MRLSELQFDLPPELIAQHAVEPRDAARLLVVHRATGALEHRHFRDIGTYLKAGDCLVVNNTRVVPARFHCRRATGARVEVLFLHADAAGWHVLLRNAGRVKAGEHLTVEGHSQQLVAAERRARGEWLVRPEPAMEPLPLLAAVGETPLPPYIHRDHPEGEDVTRYQTVYAQRPGAVAAPTAGLHFTADLLQQLGAAGVQRTDVTLHVGAGTFAPIEADDLSAHPMHAEWFDFDAHAARMLSQTRAAGGAVVAVGTTAARTLESLPPGDFVPTSRWTDIFIYPPYRFRNVDHLLTNFHLPGSTLLALVMAFASVELIRTAYAAAIERGYRFYSYGDAMLLL